MAREDAKVRVRLDTRQAKGDLRELVKDSTRTAGRVSAGIRGAVGRGLGLAGAGVAAGAGFAAVRQATSSGLGDILGETFGGIGAQLNEFFLGDLDDKARARRRAREETVAAFGTIVGANRGAIPTAARSFFTSVAKLRTQEEVGRSAFEKDDFFRGPGLGELIDRLLKGFGQLLSEAVSALAKQLIPVGK